MFDLESCQASGININPDHYKKYHTSIQHKYLYLFGSGHPLGVGVEVDFIETSRRLGLHRLSPTSYLPISIAIGLCLMYMAASFDPLCVLA
jgi:hypothetical protein